MPTAIGPPKSGYFFRHSVWNVPDLGQRRQILRIGAAHRVEHVEQVVVGAVRLPLGVGVGENEDAARDRPA